MDPLRRAFLLGRVRADAPRGADALAQIAPHCLAQRRIECRVCGEACESGAIRFAPRIGAVALPLVDAERCNGCAACVAPCPVQAITLFARSAVAECAAR